MTTNERTERVVRAWLAESVEPPRVPDYLPDLVGLTARTRQRPAWTLPERWIFMATVTRVQTAFAPVPWRALALLALLLALVGSALAYYVGRPAPLPKPFGPAANGLVAYASGGDIFTVDPATGVMTPLTSGPAVDQDPVFSRDGTRIAFTRLVDGATALFVARADGSDPTRLDVRPVDGNVEFSPDGTSILAVSLDRERRTSIVVAPVDGTTPRVLTEGMEVTEGPVFRPPGGQQILFAADRPGLGTAIFVAEPASGEVRELARAEVGWSVGMPPVPSPDGSRVAIMAWKDAPELTVRPRFLTLADGSVFEPELPPGVAWQAAFDWSNDGRSLLVARGYDGAFDRVVLAIVPAADLGSRGVETPVEVPLMRECCISAEWAPDDSAILVTPVEDGAVHGEQVLIDPRTGDVRPVPWTTNGPATWQRRAP